MERHIGLLVLRYWLLVVAAVVMEEMQGYGKILGLVEAMPVGLEL